MSLASRKKLLDLHPLTAATERDGDGGGGSAFFPRVSLECNEVLPMELLSSPGYVSPMTCSSPIRLSPRELPRVVMMYCESDEDVENNESSSGCGHTSDSGEDDGGDNGHFHDPSHHLLCSQEMTEETRSLSTSRAITILPRRSPLSPNPPISQVLALTHTNGRLDHDMDLEIPRSHQES